MSTKPYVSLPGNKTENQRHICVIFGGFDPTIGSVGRIGKTTGPYQLLKMLQSTKLKIIDFGGSFDDRNVIERAFDKIRNNFSEKGKLIIYGYSAGGINAVKLCDYIRSKYMYFKNGVFGGYNSGVGGQEDHEVFVDLLVTIDAYDPSNKRPKGIPRNVVRNINIFQTIAQNKTGSRGDTNWRRDKTITKKICNMDLSNRKKYKDAGSGSYWKGTGAAHAIIDEDTNEIVFKKIQHLISGDELNSICSLNF